MSDIKPHFYYFRMGFGAVPFCGPTLAQTSTQKQNQNRVHKEINKPFKGLVKAFHGPLKKQKKAFPAPFQGLLQALKGFYLAINGPLKLFKGLLKAFYKPLKAFKSCLKATAKPFQLLYRHFKGL